MTILQAFVLALIQSVTEFLPVSSSGHLIIIPKLFNWPLQPLWFDVVLHLGTLTAVVFYFRRDVWQILKSFFVITEKVDHDKRRLAGLILLAIIPAGLIGFAFNDLIEQRFRSESIVIINLIFWGVVLIVADWVGNQKKVNATEQSKDQNALTSLSWSQALSIGIFQIFSLIPGASRSGVTISAGIFCDLTKQAAARFSFLISIPLILAAGADQIIKIAKHGSATPIPMLTLTIGFVTAAIGGWLAIKLLMKILDSWGLKIFGFYRLILAAILIILLL
ncbi:MAG: undecaprenyl-diphosphatase UppP [Candidatus Jacksonbacteria bacterium RIFOXYC2_FULL_44_29]|nr:MAG: undecaprenyl-diphosphatase UppP [Candidatus Jacksonbacteria bacterium RIFOXYA2_FULL_43_12]OGY76307.1 MAG: undecaprenyl-diphosphatase UppP [Candidatus Jacksonbacteria bacterium RIFOXYB2_FULL_44_15]OGY78134.1 MAG: undecaprenyl-diphosphatase UppP [Candidatus Jacksonbacteria bacterium RIFOXYC2_FULL_44_29]OGY80958.1 MAG: undecaprenyl-diphosphatase UppP [Candidatus Jacksonbacteria bacterium RIFOXYD2_FULL_43_21]HCR15046.1 undecaprenyl-diphosphatase UppP [Candidatus Jacksonbacteria bacterium]